MAQSPVLQLSASVLAELNGPNYWARSNDDAKENWNRDTVDSWAGNVTASFSTKFHYSGSASDLLGEGGLIGTAYTPAARVIKEVVAWASASGSGGVTTLDVKVQYGSFSSIFTNDVLRPHLSASAGNYSLSKKSTFVSGSNMVWRAGTILRAELLGAAGAAGASGQKGVTVEVFWVPSASYGS
jgi:hypothetical protein